MNGRFAAFRNYKLTASIAAFLLVLSFYASLLLIEGEVWTPFFGAQSSSIIFYSVVFLGIGILLAKRNVPDLETFSIALATTLSAIWFYELIFHYSFPVYFNYFSYPYFDFSDTSTLLMDGALSLILFVGYKYITVRGNYLFGFLIVLFSALYVSWLLIGFPQYGGAFELPRLIQVANPFFVGYLLNRFSKLFLCLSWVSLYYR